jgi:hypothetical protein
MTNVVTPTNQAHCALFQEIRAAQNILIHRHKSNLFDFAAAMTITAPRLALQGTSTGDAD